MKPSNAEIFKKIQDSAPIFQGARRSDITMQIRCKMVQKGLRNVDIAARLGVSEANVSRWLKGNQNLSLDTLYQLSDAVEEPLNIVVGSFDVYGEAECGAPTDGAPRSACNVIKMSEYATMRAQIPSVKARNFAIAHSESGVGLGEFEELKVK